MHTAARVESKQFRVRVIAVWDAIEPFVSTERSNEVSGLEFFTGLEAFAVKARQTSPEVGQKIIDRWLRKRPARVRSGIRALAEARSHVDPPATGATAQVTTAGESPAGSSAP